MVWLGFFEKNVFLRTSGVRAKPSKRISTFSVAKGLRIPQGSVEFQPQKSSKASISTPIAKAEYVKIQVL